MLTVSSRNAVAPYRGRDVGMDSVGTALDVGTLIVGSLEKSGSDKVRLTTRLYDGSGADLRKNTTVTFPRDSLFAAGTAIAAKVSESLREPIGKELQLQESQARAGNLRAWTLVQRGEKLRKDAEQAALRDPKSAVPLLVEADTLLQQAAEADPQWVDPVLVKGDVALQHARIVGKDEKLQWFRAGRNAADQALKIDPTNARALALKGTVQYQEWRLALNPDQAARKALLDSAEAALRDAVSADNSLAPAYVTLSFIEFEKKDVPSSLREASNAYSADKFLSNSDLVLDRLFFGSYNTEQFAEAQKWCEEGGRRFPGNPTFTQCHLWLMLAPDAQRDVPRAWQLAARLDSLYAGRPDSVRAFQQHFAQILVGGAIGKSVSGTPSPLVDSARSMLLRARADSRVDSRHELPGYEAVMRVRIGDLDEAISLLKEYVGYNPDHSFRVGNNIHWWWRPLTDKPGFKALLARGQ